MFNLRKFLMHAFISFSISYLLFFYSLDILSAREINWVEVANVDNEIQFIDTDSIKYNNKGFLSVMTKYSEVNSTDQMIINSNSYLIAIDCENRLFSKIPENGELNQVKNWTNPINDKLIKKTIINSCSY